MSQQGRSADDEVNVLRQISLYPTSSERSGETLHEQ